MWNKLCVHCCIPFSQLVRTYVCTGYTYVRMYICTLSVCRTIKVWDLKAALDPRTPVQNLCLRTLVVSVGVKNGFGGFVDKVNLDYFQDFWDKK